MSLRLSALVTLALLLGPLAGCRGAPEGPLSVLVVSADSLRRDRLRLYAPDDGVPTPHLEALAARGTVYADAWAVSPWTAPSMVSVFTGLYPPGHGVAYRDDTTPPGLATLPRLLAERGWHRADFSFFSQISYFRNLGLGPHPEGVGHGSVPAAFARWLSGVPAGEPFFAWVHLLEPHLPYGAGGYQSREVKVAGSDGLVRAQLEATLPLGTATFAPGDRERLLALYDEDVAGMDRSLGELLAALDAQGRTADTLVVLVADHGEELLEDGWVGHASTAAHAKLLPEILRIPLVLAGPGVPVGELRRGLVQQVDLLPTVVRLAGLELDGLAGRPLPGTGGPWAWLLGERRHAFFDTSPGGNLTPQEQRGERLQGVTDGRCLLTARVAPGRPEVVAWRPVEAGPDEVCAPAGRRRLAEALADWRRDQAAQRLALLAGAGEGASAPADADAYAPLLEVLSPVDGARLDHRESGGQITLEWKAHDTEEDPVARAPAGAGGGAAGTTVGDRKATEARTYWIEYQAGEGVREVSGAFRVEAERTLFGPIPEGFWNDLAGYSPFRFRVLDPEGSARSDWVRFELTPVA